MVNGHPVPRRAPLIDRKLCCAGYFRNDVFNLAAVNYWLLRRPIEIAFVKRINTIWRSHSTEIKHRSAYI